MRQIRKDVAVLSQFVADRLCRVARIVNRKNAPAGPLNQLLHNLQWFGHITANGAARSILSLDHVNSDVQGLQHCQDIVEFCFAAAIYCRDLNHH